MVLVRVASSYLDIHAGQLCFALGLPPQPHLHRVSVPTGAATRAGGAATVELRLLGASHQVILADRYVTLLSETVAYLDGAEPLPRNTHRDTRAGAYRFSSTVRRLGPSALVSTVARVRGRLDRDPGALVGVFPGSEYAVTMLAVEPDTGDGVVRWRTWHAYPQAGQLVETRTIVDPAAHRSGLRAAHGGADQMRRQEVRR